MQEPQRNGVALKDIRLMQLTTKFNRGEIVLHVGRRGGQTIPVSVKNITSAQVLAETSSG
jgi:hypothetical protein